MTVINVTAYSDVAARAGKDNCLTNITAHAVGKPPHQVTHNDMRKVVDENNKYGRDYKAQHGHYPPGWQELDRNNLDLVRHGPSGRRNPDGTLATDSNGKPETYKVYTGTFTPPDHHNIPQ